MLSFRITHEDSAGFARAGLLTTRRGEVPTPAFMPVGSLGNVRSVDGEELLKMGYELILNNAYHLFLRPGHKIVQELGGVHGFTAWPGAILTDSGGFQVFSLAKFCKVTDEGVIFQSHIDGSSRFISPETSIEIQEALGADIIMAFDHVVALPSPLERVRDAAQRTSLWARRCLSAKWRTDQSLFGIVQGGIYQDLRCESAEFVAAMNTDGIAIGGETIGFDMQRTVEVINWVRPFLPENKTRYTMGVGMSPQDLLDVVAEGIDIFDCVAPTRNARHGALYCGEIVRV